MVMMTGSLAVRGTVVWLTPQQGGRVSGPPEPDYDYDYTATAYLPPRTAEDGQAGLSLRRFAPGAWRTPAEGILVPAKGNRAQQVVPGNLVVITEGVRPVGLLTVEEVNALEPDATAVTDRVPEPEITGLTTLRPGTDAGTDAPYRHSTATTRWSAHERAGAS
ncbi:hypothetical protein [Kribbella sp. CA-293567]|uniref:hypothetical protein n=1 Tax=Kribbella sp. CA-293567 TaxID=3002436 RepID=UPI0022DD512B|nr:hypothetical protein [Kribbella sp. CA-293567]WBQ02823.1 hypothetical protein OX958_22885 [Kribbella sp. CA-293567]